MIIFQRKTFSIQFSILKFLICFCVFSYGIKTHEDDDNHQQSSSSQIHKIGTSHVKENPVTILGIEFSDSPWGRKALQPRTKAFERLEFLGDRVLGLITAHMLYKCYPLKNIGWLAEAFSKLVSKPSLLRIYKACHIDSSLLASSSYQAPVMGPIAEKTASDIIEALIGAVYKDSGYYDAQAFGESLIRSCFKVNPEAEATVSLRSSLITSDKIQTFVQRRKLPQLLELFGYAFRNNHLLYDAFQHPSVGGMPFKKLDFIGVRVLALAIAEKVYTDFPDADEGILMAQNEQLINNDNLGIVFQKWQLWRYLAKQYNGFIGELIAPERVPSKMASGTVRTFIGAIYLDGGWQCALSAAHRLLFTEPPPDFFEPIFRLTDLTIKSLPRVNSPPITSKEDLWPSLKNEDMASDEGSPVLKQGASNISSTQSTGTQVSAPQPTYLDIAKRQQTAKCKNDDDNSESEDPRDDPWPELTPKKTADSSPPKIIRQNPKKNSEVWKDTATTMKSVMPQKRDDRSRQAKY
jgi:dsRNA-specific ribonuclease